MPRNELKTFLVECSAARPEDLSGNSVTLSADEALPKMGEADLLLFPVTHQRRRDLEAAAEAAGLLVSLLVFPQQGEPHLARIRFGSHKWALKSLGALADCRPLTDPGDAPYERYRKLVNRVSDGVVEVDSQDVIRWTNTALCQALDSENLVGQKLESLVDPGDLAQLHTLREQHAGGVVVAFPLRLVNGEMVEVDPSPRFDSEGRLLGASLVFRKVGRDQDEVVRSRQLFNLYSIASAMGQGQDLQDMLRATVAHSLDLLRLSAGGVFLGENLELALGVESPEALLQPLAKFCQVGPEMKAAVERTFADEHPLTALGYGGGAAVPLRTATGTIGTLWFLSQNTGDFSREVVSLLISVANQLAVVVENQRHLEQQLAAETEKRQFYRDALCAVTQGKLVLCELDELHEVWQRSGELLGKVDIHEVAQVPVARSMVEEALKTCGLTDERVADMALCTTEAVGNVVKHADSGLVEVRASEETLRVMVLDTGPGIDFAQLPSAVLTAGYSTAPSLGMGYSILLELLDRLYLSTGDQGTTLILEMARKEADPLDAFMGFLAED